MNYGADRPAVLKYDPFKAIIVPRPIGWIGTMNADGVPNLAPYSFFTMHGTRPHMISFTSEGDKHSVVNARDRAEFTFSLVTEDLAQAMNATSAPLPDGADEFAAAGLTRGHSIEIAAPFVAESPAALECVTLSTTQLRDRNGCLTGSYLVLGEVVRTHIKDAFIQNGRFDTVKARPIARMGYRDYATVTDAWELMRPSD
ncbi:flavin reductase family protein [Roseicitreum antarcticum]|uniref:NADH-FMN oxidoreductase RutF, flavin reductase (DIM6/NTAB) family n=1 Tax=Roseicitreum antarcticum TaxID=564137 RepID=A0A1H2YXL2_9RHOB|nr:flavin reductase family protein [Roseicitreum antarcticum]SDX09299.1 NADH-FMN oxidoreductase RutF, flavin reductase (DIM6/NTAB) family [Roseicitreum antarcticum]